MVVSISGQSVQFALHSLAGLVRLVCEVYWSIQSGQSSHLSQCGINVAWVLLWPNLKLDLLASSSGQNWNLC